MAVRPTLLRDLDSLLQRLECNNEVTWIICNLSFADYRSLFGLIGSLLIKYNLAAPLILHQDSLNLLLSKYLLSHPCSTCSTLFSHTYCWGLIWHEANGRNPLRNSSLEKRIFFKDPLQGSVFVLRRAEIRSVEDKCECSQGGLCWYF